MVALRLLLTNQQNRPVDSFLVGQEQPESSEFHFVFLKEGKEMKLTDRDIEILRFINDFGFCTTPHLMNFISVRQWRIYQIMNRLVRRGLVKKEFGFQGHPLIYYLTDEGASFTDLPAIDAVSFGVYLHQVAMVNVALKLMRLYPEATWVSERHLKYDKFIDGVGVRGHIADGLLLFPDAKRVAIEVELSVKGKRRLDGILKSYSAQFDIKEIWYFCSPKAYSSLTGLVGKKTYIKLFTLKEFLA